MKKIPLYTFITIALVLIAAVISTAAEKPVIVQKEELPVVGSLENLKKLLAESNKQRLRMPSVMVQENMPTGAQKSAAGKPGYSTTNVQVEGVDEADLVKTCGEYIYQVNDAGVIITKAYPAEDMKVIKTLNFDEGFRPLEIYVDNEHLVVIGSTRHDFYFDKKVRKEICIYPPPRESTTRAVIYSIKDKNNITKMREVDVDGRYVSSRKIDKSVYLVANKGINYHIMEDKVPAPSYRDSNSHKDFRKIDYKDIHYLPDCVSPNYILVCGFNLDAPEKEAEVYTYLGAGDNIYASRDNLYVAAAKYEPGNDVPLPQAPPEENTVVYKFALDKGSVKYTGKGEVPGHILNQFSMDEYKGYFRIATTRGQVWRTGEYTSRNNLYVLEPGMEITGKVEDIAPGERIYSTRFMGDRAYMITFKKVDPLFVIDLKDPANPKILGKLKIPGYSDYLHPFDENHIIGFGKDTVEVKDGNTAYYQGMKLAIFDVSDVKHPEEMFKEIIGDRGTDSELLRNHKALLFSKDKNLLAFPVTVMEINNKFPGKDYIRHGQFTFQGAYVYHVSLEKGFVLRGKITHLTGSDYLKSGSGWYDSDKNIRRVLYIGDNLYTLSDSMIKVHDLHTMKEKNNLFLQ